MLPITVLLDKISILINRTTPQTKIINKKKESNDNVVCLGAAPSDVDGVTIGVGDIVSLGNSNGNGSGDDILKIFRKIKGELIGRYSDDIS